jgi:hypothetical protein
MWHKAQAQLSQSLAGRPGVGVISISALPTCKGGSVHEVSNAQSWWRPSWAAGRPGFGELPPQMNDEAHSLHL